MSAGVASVASTISRAASFGIIAPLHWLSKESSDSVGWPAEVGRQRFEARAESALASSESERSFSLPAQHLAERGGVPVVEAEVVQRVLLERAPRASTRSSIFFWPVSSALNLPLSLRSSVANAPTLASANSSLSRTRTLWLRSFFWNLAFRASARRALATMAAPSPRDGDDGGCDAVSEPGDSKLGHPEMDEERLEPAATGLDGESLRELLKEPPGESSTNSLDEARATGGIAVARSCASGEGGATRWRFPTRRSEPR